MLKKTYIKVLILVFYCVGKNRLVGDFSVQNKYADLSNIKASNK